MIKVMAALIGCLCGALMLSVASTFRTRIDSVRVFERVNKTLREKRNSIFDYEEINRFLRAKGVIWRYGKRMNPITYLMLRVLVAVVFFAVVVRFSPASAPCFALIGFWVPKIWFIYQNKKDNEKMLSQILTIYNVVEVRLRAGVHIKKALSECSRGLRKGRLRTELEALSNEIYLKNSITEAVRNFNNKFDCQQINAFCTLILQAQESGMAVELLKDMSEQIKGMKAAMLRKKMDRLVDRTSLYAVVIAGALIFAIMKVCLESLMETVYLF